MIRLINGGSLVQFRVTLKEPVRISGNIESVPYAEIFISTVGFVITSYSIHYTKLYETTAAIGLAVRALGQGLRVLLVRLLKPLEPPSGEVKLLEALAGIEILTAGVGVIHGRPDPQRVAESVQQVFSEARARILAGGVDVAIFDEANSYNFV